jgi:tRNA threonylcarbamoyladenosine biosynthesis protein TsaE
VLIIRAQNPDETLNFGFHLGKLLQIGDCICLAGTLGAGKTLLAQGIARGLDVAEGITSPTFTVLQVYDGRLPVFHYDLYRLQQPEELRDIGFEEFGGENGVMVIEWADKFSSYMPEEALWIELSSGLDSLERKIILNPHGTRYENLLKELSQNDHLSY